MKQLLSVVATLSMLALAGTSRADLNRVGPANVPSPPGHGFPAWYQDLNGLTLDFCIPNASDPGQLQQNACLLVAADLPNPPYAFPASFPDEVFYFRAVSTPIDTSDPPGAGTSRAILVLALEAAFASGGAAAGQQITFTRIRITAGLPHPGTWTVTHPYGIETFVVETASGARDIAFSEDVGVAPGAFTGALASRVGPFLQASAVAGGPPNPPVILNGAPFLSDGLALEQLTGSPFGTNYFELCGPYDGATVTCRNTPLFTLTGRVHVGLIGSPLQVDRATYSRSAAGAQVDVSATAKAGIGQAAPVLTAAASTVAPVLLSGPTALGEWYGQGLPVPPDAIPSLLTVINSGDVPPTAAVARVTDVVTVKSAGHDGGTLTVVATSSDKGDAVAQPPVLSLDGFPSAAVTLSSAADPAETTFTVALAVPPPSVRVSSAVGGQGQAEVVMGALAPFAPGVPLATDDGAVATAGAGPVVIPVLANDVTGSLAPVLPVTLLAAPTLGAAAANPDGTVSYTPSSVAGTATFQYTVSNAAGRSNVATVTVAVEPSPFPTPVAVDDPSAGTLTVSTGGSLTIGVLANDSGNGGTLDPASILVSAVTGGTAVANPAGTVTYTAGGAAGSFGFTYTVANTNGNRSNPATVAVSVLNPEVITLKGAQCQRQGTQWVVSGSSTVLSGTMTLFNVSPVPAAPTTAQVIANVPIAAGRWQYNVKGGPACVSPISLQSTGGGRLNGVVVTIK